MVYVGIDPGKQGAIAAILSADWKDLGSVVVNNLPLITSPKGKSQYDIQKIKRMLLQVYPAGCFVTIEDFHGFPRGKGHVVSMAEQKRIVGILEGLCVGLEIPYALVSPVQWQKEMLAGAPGKDAKQRSMVVAPRLFPKADLRKPRGKLDPNKCDAALIAAFGMIRYGRFAKETIIS